MVSGLGFLLKLTKYPAKEIAGSNGSLSISVVDVFCEWSSKTARTVLLDTT